MSRDTSMREAPQRRYSYQSSGRAGESGSRGNFILQQNAGMEIYKPSWKKTVTTVRLFPAVSLEDPNQFDPWRWSDEPEHYGDWIRTYPAAVGVGNPGISFLMYDPTDPTYDVGSNPYWIFYNAISRAVKAGTAKGAWAAWTVGSEGKGKALAFPSQISVTQGMVYEHTSKVCTPPKGAAADDRPTCFILSKSAKEALVEQMEMRGEPGQPTFPNGDPVDLKTGQFIRFFELGADPRQQQQAPQHVPLGQVRRQASGQQGQADMKGYGCYMTPVFNGISSDLSAWEPFVRTRWRPWDSILRFPDHAEQVRMLSGVFSPDAIVYAFQDHMELVPPQTIDAARRIESMAPASRGAVYGAGYGAGPGYGAQQAAPAAPYEHGPGVAPGTHGQSYAPPEEGFVDEPAQYAPPAGYGQPNPSYSAPAQYAPPAGYGPPPAYVPPQTYVAPVPQQAPAYAPPPQAPAGQFQPQPYGAPAGPAQPPGPVPGVTTPSGGLPPAAPVAAPPGFDPKATPAAAEVHSEIAAARSRVQRRTAPPPQ